MNGKYSIEINSAKLAKPLGTYLYFAKDKVYEKTNGSETPISHDFGETWGTTEKEAESKMSELIHEWIKKHDEKQLD